jgi:RNA polymerase sigma-70 factor (ECF subfamily)
VEWASVGGDGANESDESVLKRLNAGEQRAMGELWGRYAGLLFSQALRVLHNPAEAEDVVVEVFSEVWRRAGGYHPERARPAAWLVTLVRRRAIDRFRERRSHERAEERLAMERGGCDSNDGIEEQVRLSELRRLLEQALKRLPERQREAVCLVYFEGLTQREISKRTRTPIGTVKTRLELGLRKMRERIRSARLRPRIESGVREEGFSFSAEA